MSDVPNVEFSNEGALTHEDELEAQNRRAYEEWKRSREEEKPVEVEHTKSSGSRSVPTEATKSEAKPQQTEEDVIPQSYVWLANGEVLLANNEDIPQPAGHGAWHGYWEKDGLVHTIVAVHPKETKKVEK